MESAINATLDKSLCTDFVVLTSTKTDLDAFRGPKTKKNISRYNSKSFKKDIANEFKRYQCVSLEQYDFKQFLRLRNQLTVAADNFTKEDNLPYINIVGLSRDIDKQLKHVHKVIEIAEGPSAKCALQCCATKRTIPKHSTRRYDSLHAGRRKKIFNNLSMSTKKLMNLYIY